VTHSTRGSGIFEESVLLGIGALIVRVATISESLAASDTSQLTLTGIAANQANAQK
jgi:hypothetical protein